LNSMDKMILADSAGLSDVGKVRKVNEDYYFLDNDLGLYIVADGMGGYNSGDQASRIVVETVRDGARDVLKDKQLLSAEDILTSVRYASKRVNRIAKQNKLPKGMGSTVAAVFFSRQNVIACNVGDSNIYLVRDNELELISIPHTVVNEYKPDNPEMAHRFKSKYGNLLTRGVGIREDVKPDYCEIPCFKDDMIVICSDGLSNMVPDEKILRVVSKNNPENAVKKLTTIANDAGGIDNITVVVIKIKAIYRWNIMKKLKKFFLIK